MVKRKIKQTNNTNRRKSIDWQSFLFIYFRVI